ncbi:MFS transporter [Sinomonas sp. ASV486]|uniref:MFS transporter n=1 Tax=Sinomonas sp. ASV486 TaxID=3051170 RepID=UPI0027DE5622|nr:MFS transporter [Sinomonas sp. ASV486]MDQ4491583.1 MFS transporter [Sinomonas sp. ASV486]
MDIHAAIDEARFTRFHKKLVAACMGGPILDGYILSIIAIALIGISADFHTTPLETSLIGAAALVGIFLGAVLLGPLTDKIGRQLMYTIDLWVLVLGSVLQFFVQDALQLVIARFIMGLAIGADYPIANSLLAEWLPRKRRGQMLGVLNVGWFMGAALASIVGYVMFEIFGEESWRWMLVSSTFLGAIVMLLRLGTPESPRWLLHHGRVKDAKAALRAALADQMSVDHVVFETARPDKSKQGKLDLKILLKPIYLRRIIFCAGFYAFQVGPLFAIYTFGPTILSSFGLAQGNVSNLGSVAIDMVFLIGCLPALKLIETWGRRPLIIWCFALMSIPLFVLGFAPSAPVGIVVACFLAYALFSGGPSILEWAYPSELFPTNVRASAVGITTAVSRIGAALGTFGLPFALEGWGIGPTMIVAAVITFAGFLLSLFLAEETKGMSLAKAGGQPADDDATPATAAAPALAVRTSVAD